MKRLSKSGQGLFSAIRRDLFGLLKALVVWSALAAASVASAAVSYNTIALSGATGTGLGLGPNLGAGINFTVFDKPVLNAACEVAFGGTLSGTGVTFTNDYGIWSAAGGTRALVARSGSDGPDGPGFGTGINFTVFSNDLVLNAAGDIAFSSQITGSTSRGGIWSNTGGSLSVVARKGSDGPAGPGLGVGVRFFNELPGINVLFNAAGAVAFRGTLTGTGVMSGANDLGIWSNAGGSLAVVARTGPGGPGPGLDETNSFSDFGNPVLNVAGKVAFFGNIIANPGSTNGIWSNAGGSLAVVARSGSDGPGPGLGAGISFASFGNSGMGNPVINAAGELAFRGSLIGTGVSSTNKDGIWSTAGGALAMVARSGSEGPGPGLGPGVNFSSFGNVIAPVINASGKVAFFGSLTGTGVNATNNRGIWSNVGGSLAVVARSGSDGPGPGLEPGVNFSFFSDPLINSAGKVAFRGFLTGSGVNSSNDQGIWSDAGGSLQKIVRKGDQLDVDPGAGVDLRTILEIGFGGDLSVSTWAGEGSGRGMFFNDSGVLAFTLTFTDGSDGIFTAQGSAAGNFNGDGAVDASDYVIWRKTGGSQGDYTTWRAHFGQSLSFGSGSGANANATVPEPATAFLILMAAAGASTLMYWCPWRVPKSRQRVTYVSHPPF